MNEFWDVVNKVDEHVKHNLGKEVEEVEEVGKEGKNNQIETWS